ncbi:uncharacterized protein STEHIDRAFT_125027 [Stereum hirsutum FP-91666 SS1]|uniref:uncharacterized protein n=1 Tax=Stereum hirsutum (strain FP-91666) TaxID=721885 RepID=UPI0004449F0E|nr:uncharacterized protein STEHIDRAFT_125027 [Stereum hirsutum FP-91666 SS1]EIM81456.1 hypothetical protein STEHIDRAFT_125027 [Stereum hirsutum FP-91666 SS1]
MRPHTADPIGTSPLTSTIDTTSPSTHALPGPQPPNNRPLLLPFSLLPTGPHHRHILPTLPCFLYFRTDTGTRPRNPNSTSNSQTRNSSPINLHIHNLFVAQDR